MPYSTAGREEPAPQRLPVSQDEMINDYGVVTVVSGFLPGTDRLVLDFDEGADLPEVTFDLSVEQGSTAVMGNGLLMVVLRGAAGVSISDIEMRHVPVTSTPVFPAMAEDLRGVRTIENYNPAEDVIEIACDPATTDESSVMVEDFPDGTGAYIFFNGKPVLAVRGAQGLRPADVNLVPHEVI
ncbi:MAG: hypothetical protein AAGA70_06400 [Pseudomonadota bacterium]